MKNDKENIGNSEWEKEEKKRKEEEAAKKEAKDKSYTYWDGEYQISEEEYIKTPPAFRGRFTVKVK